VILVTFSSSLIALPHLRYSLTNYSFKTADDLLSLYLSDELSVRRTWVATCIV
jgi:hypothetical protein